MPSKIVFNLVEMASNGGHVYLQHDGELPVELRRVKRLVVVAEAGDPPMVELTMYSPDFESEVLISDLTAEAIAMHERQRQLAFISEAEAASLRELLEVLGGIYAGLGSRSPGTEGLKTLTMIVGELAKRQEIPF